jgi:hypothetical protein
MGTEVAHYGIHWAPGKIAFLQQGRNGTNAIGLKTSSPFEVKPRRRATTCNHLIAPNATNPARGHLTAFQNLVLENSLVRFMLPVPKSDTETGVGVISDLDVFYTTLLLKMSSPVKLPVIWASLANPVSILAELESTNVQPLVLSGVTVRTLAMARDLAQAARTLPRKLLIVTDADTPIRPNLDAKGLLAADRTDLLTLPWETLGAIVVRAFMRQEWNGTWFTREPTPGNEAKT